MKQQQRCSVWSKLAMWHVDRRETCCGGHKSLVQLTDLCEPVTLSIYNIVTARQINDIIEAPDAPGHRHGHGHNRANYPCSGLVFMATFQIARIGFASLQLCLANKLFAYLTQIVAPTAERGGGG